MDAGRAVVHAPGVDLLEVVPESPGETDPLSAHERRVGRERAEGDRHRGKTRLDARVVGGALAVSRNLPEPEPHEEGGAGERDEQAEQGFGDARGRAGVWRVTDATRVVRDPDCTYCSAGASYGAARRAAPPPVTRQPVPMSAPMHRRSAALAALLAFSSLLSCGREVTGPAGAGRLAEVQLNPVFSTVRLGGTGRTMSIGEVVDFERGPHRVGAQQR
jgi:hypothetical protein